jgi:tRNA threonylcarbamoyl adenosine modification protein YeaZ
MRILAIDTALAACAAAVFDTDTRTVLAVESLGMTRGHAEALMPLVARVIDQADIGFDELDRIAVSVGPGSFTGLRVGISAARGIALVSGKPAVGISTLAALAAPHIAKRDGNGVVAAIDARHGHLYLQVFASNGRSLVGPQIATVDEAVADAMASPAHIVGSGASLIAAAWPVDGDDPVSIDPRDAAPIEWIARLGSIQAEIRPTPLYLRAPDAWPQDGARLPRQ